MRLSAILIGLAVSPITVFMLLYSLDVGCFICLYGKASGSVTEAVLNVALLVALIGFVGVVICDNWKRGK